MPICADLHNLVVLKTAAEERYPGGLAQLRADLDFDPTNTAHQEDAELLSVGTMDADAAFGLLAQLANKGLRYSTTAPEDNDMVVIFRYGAPPQPLHWLRYNAIYAWHTACDPALASKADGIRKLTVEEFLSLVESGVYPMGPIV